MHLFALFCVTESVTSLIFLSDLATPSFVIDVHAVSKTLSVKNADVPIPPILLPTSKKKLVATSDPKYEPCPHSFDASIDPIDILDASVDPRDAADVCYGYVHTKVAKPRQEKGDNADDAYLVELDVPDETQAHLVLGLNNHHVVSYYWARSAGAGAAMEAPGIRLKGSRLFWQSDKGFTSCNSNDGKRSEWVNFLKTGDQVQLRPEHAEETVLQYADCIYGISAKGRPLGSEPVVICKWELADL